MHEGMNQIRKRLLGKLVLTNSASQCDKHRMLRLACIHAIEFAAPPIQQPETFCRVADLIAKIVRPAAERIDVVEVLVKLLRKQEADYVEFS